MEFLSSFERLQITQPKLIYVMFSEWRGPFKNKQTTNINFVSLVFIALQGRRIKEKPWTMFGVPFLVFLTAKLAYPYFPPAFHLSGILKLVLLLYLCL